MKNIKFNFEGIDYTLEFTKGSVKKMGEDGFVLAKIQDNPVIIQDLFAGSFIANHRHAKPELIRRIFDRMPNREQLYDSLVEMYLEPISELYDEPSDSEKNISWESNFKSSIEG